MNTISGMPIRPPIPMPEVRPVPVPMKQDNRWKYGLAAAIVLLLLLLLLLLIGTKATGTGTHGDGTQATGTGTDLLGTGHQDGDTTDADSAGEADAHSADEDATIAEPAETLGDPETGADEKTTQPVVTVSEPTRESAIDDLLRRLTAEPEENMDSQPEDRQNQTGGNALVKGDASVNFFGATGKGSKFVFVFDRSGSMSGRPLESVKRELIKALEPLKSNHSFDIIAYDHTVEAWKDKLISATKENKADAVGFIERISSRGGTEPRAPLLAAIDHKPEIIFFMTDGEFVLNVDEICARGKKIIINVVQFSDGLPLAVLQELAKRTGGEFMLIKVRGLNDSL